MFIAAITWYLTLYPAAQSRPNKLQGYTHSNGITNGSDNPEKRCREAQATCAFLWAGFATFSGSLVLSAMSSRSGSNFGRGVGGGREVAPSMSQV